MFTPLNKETSKKRLKSMLKERRMIKEIYYKFLINMDIDNVFNIKTEYDENRDILYQVKEYALFNLVDKFIDKVDPLKYDIFSYKKAAFLYIHSILKKKEYVKAKKMLNICKEKGYECNEYYELVDEVRKHA
jgi:hypothetical protein